MTGIIDYGMGNLHSVSKALAFLGYESKIVTDAAGFAICDRLILPGVGAFPDAMRALEPIARDIKAAVAGGTPLLGICLGMQLLFETSEESGGAKGLGLLPGAVRRFPGGLIVPHMGWSALDGIHGALFNEVTAMDAYFVHSYFCPVGDYTCATAHHGIDFTAALNQGNLYGTQFHPEKSGSMGLKLLDNFARL